MLPCKSPPQSIICLRPQSSSRISLSANRNYPFQSSGSQGPIDIGQVVVSSTSLAPAPVVLLPLPFRFDLNSPCASRGYKGSTEANLPLREAKQKRIFSSRKESERVSCSHERLSQIKRLTSHIQVVAGHLMSSGS